MTKDEWYVQLFERLGNSRFRSSFHLKQKDIDYINEKGLDTIREHARDFIAKREAPAVIPNDGKQTPMRGHPVFIAQHATATCCRGCIQKWHKISPEHPWHDRNAVLRRKDNDKWYGVVLEVAGDKLGLSGDGIVDVLNVKSDPMLIGSLRGQDGYFPAYHMNKEKWISVLLGREELDESIKDLLSLSYELTAPKKRGKKVCFALHAICGHIEEP